MDLRRFFPPIFFLEADGDISREIIPFIKRFEFSDEHKKPDEIKMIFINDGFRWTDDDRFARGVKYRVRWGYPSLWSDTLSFKIHKVIPLFPQKDVPTITMIAWDSRIDLSETVACNFGPVSSSEVARVLAKRWGLKEDIEESNDARKQDRVQPLRSTDLGYLSQLAEKINFQFDIVGDTLVFKKHGYSDQWSLEYTYFIDNQGVILEFKPEIKEKKLRKKAGLATTDPKTGKADVLTPKEKPADVKIVRANNKGITIAKTIGGTAGSTPEGDKVAKQQADAVNDKIDLDADKAVLKVIGDPRLRKGKVIKINNVGKFYSGTWYVSSTKHVIDSTAVYTTECKIQRSPLGDAGKKTKDDKDDKDKASKDYYAKLAVVRANNTAVTVAKKYK